MTTWPTAKAEWQRRRAALFRTVLAPPPKVTVSEWADRYRVLSREASAEAGKWRTSRAPYLKAVMDALGDPSIESVAVKFASQLGKTEVINNTVGFFIDQDPSPILVLQPTVDLASAWSTDRLSPMLRDTPRLAGKVKEARTRDSGNTILHKQFVGGHLTITGANSAASLAARPIRIVLCDEVDRYPASAGSEGDPVGLARKRTATFWNRKIILVSSPTTKGMSRIDEAYEESDQRQFFVPCPHCGFFQTLSWGGVTWDAGHPETAHYVCSDCGAVIEEWQKPAMLAGGEWRAAFPERRVAGFWLNALYSPWARWEEHVREWQSAQKNPELLKVFTNTVLAELWEEAGDQVEAHMLFERLEDYGGPKDPDGHPVVFVPDGVAILTAAVDVQGDRLEATIWGWGPGEESWFIDTLLVPGDPGTPAPWQTIDAYLARPIPSAYGVPFTVAAAFVDSGGHHTKQVYDFTRERIRRRIFACKGGSVSGAPLLGKPSRLNSARVVLYTVGPDTAKDAIASRLRIVAPGAGYVHLPVTADREVLEQLTAERKITRYTRGRPIRAWMKTRDRNEQLDLFVYSLACLATFGPQGIATLPARLAKFREEAVRLRAEAEAHAEDPTHAAEPSAPTSPRDRKAGWVNRWR